MKLINFLKNAVQRYDDTHNFTCDICSCEVFDGERLCRACDLALPRVGEVFCPFCGRKVLETGACLDCKQKPLKTKKARSVCVHEGEAARLMLRFKRGAKYLVRTLGALMLPVLQAEFAESDALVFVPMTKKAEKKRGYNQARLLAEELSKHCGKPVLDCVAKVRETEAQKTLGRAAREENLQGCFRVTDRSAVKGLSLLVVDDAMTTGSTASEIADVLLRAGAKEVNLLTFTSVQRKNPFGEASEQKRGKGKKMPTS